MSSGAENSSNVITTVLLSVLCSVLFVVGALLCACWRRKPPKDEMHGPDGMVTHKNPDENVNHLLSPQSTEVSASTTHFVGNDTITVDVIVDDVDSINSKRPSSGTNTQRSLPDIPSESRPENLVQYEPNGDNSSELYATVEPPYQSAVKRPLTNGSVSQHSSISQADDSISPYAQVRYKKPENPYAEVHEAGNNNATNRSTEERHSHTGGISGGAKGSVARDQLLEVASSSASGGTQQTAPSRTSIDYSQPSTSTMSATAVSAVSAQQPHRNSVQGSVDCISAASAVAGGIAASQELPYMTPPIYVATSVEPAVGAAAVGGSDSDRDADERRALMAADVGAPHQQLHFSGDSQDSSKGYSSITVREPLENILPMAKAISSIKRDLDPHYSTVSDDSDEMYTTIPDGNRQPNVHSEDSNNAIYTSGSETYAQIQPITVAVEINHNPPTENPIVDSLLMQPSTSAAPDHQPHVAGQSKDGNAAVRTHSPHASSASTNLNLGSPKPEKRPANSPLPPPPPAVPATNVPSMLSPNGGRSLDEMYAKVHKNRNKTDKQQSSPSSTLATCGGDVDPMSTDTSGAISKYKRREHNYETLRKAAGSTRKQASESESEGCDPGYERLRPPECGEEPGYASISEGCDMRLGSGDPNYEQLRLTTPSGAGSETVTGGSSSTNRGLFAERSQQSAGSGGSDDTNTTTTTTTTPRMYSEMEYVALLSTDTETGQDYESVSQSEPNYESVKYLDVELEHDSISTQKGGGSQDGSSADYERINTDGSGTSRMVPEVLDSVAPSRCNNNNDDDEDDDTSFGYERISKKTEDSNVVSDIFQV